MAAAARALGWPEQIVDASRAQLQTITKMQIQIIDQMMDIWQEQIKSPNPMAATSAMLSKLKSLPGASPAGTWPNADAFAGAASNIERERLHSPVAPFPRAYGSRTTMNSP